MQSNHPKPELIVMLTHQDKTVRMHWISFSVQKLSYSALGFKDVGLSPQNAAHNNSDERCREGHLSGGWRPIGEEGLRGARLAVDLGFDILMGTVFYPSIGDYLKDKPIHYYPFPGHVHSHPSLLDGTIDDIVAHVYQLGSYGAHGLDLLTYRFNGEAAHLLSKLLRQRKYLSYLQAVLPPLNASKRFGMPMHGDLIGSAFFDKSLCRMARLKKTYGQCLIGWNGNKP